MFTLQQVGEIHDTLGKATTLRAYLEALSAIGVESAISFIADGHTEFRGKNDHVVVSPAAHGTFVVAEVSNLEQFHEALKEKNYEQMSKALAEAGVEKWIFDTQALTITYYDKPGNTLLQENIK